MIFWSHVFSKSNVAAIIIAAITKKVPEYWDFSPKTMVLKLIKPIMKKIIKL